MPRYFLQTEHFDREPIADEEGADFESVDAASIEAEEGVRELLAAAIRDTHAPVPNRIRILNESGREVGVVSARDVVPRQLR